MAGVDPFFEAAEPIGDFLVRRDEEGLLGRGSFSETYRAWQKSLGREVAFKIFTGPFGEAADPDAAARFREREIPSMVRLAGHAGIASPVDAGELPDGSPWIAMERIRGPSLRALLRESTIFPVAEAIRIAMDLCDAVAAAHEAGVWHRDIKPENIILAEEGPRAGRPVLIDWGTAKIRDAAARLVTDESRALGTRAYMAPERLTTGMPDDHRADLYSLGAVLYETLTGLVPEDAPSHFPIADLRHGEARTDLDPIVRRALEPDPARRYPDARALRKDLEEYLAHRPAQRGPGWLAAGLALLAVAALASAFWPREAPPRRVAVPPPRPRPIIQPAPPDVPPPGVPLFALAWDRLEPWVEAQAIPLRAQRRLSTILTSGEPVHWRLRDGSEVSGVPALRGDAVDLTGDGTSRTIRFPSDVEPSSLGVAADELAVWLLWKGDVEGAARLDADVAPAWRSAMRAAFLSASRDLDAAAVLRLYVHALERLAGDAADAGLAQRRAELEAWEAYETRDTAALWRRYAATRAAERAAVELVSAIDRPDARTVVPGFAPGSFDHRAEGAGEFAAAGNLLRLSNADGTSQIGPHARLARGGQFVRLALSARRARISMTPDVALEVRPGEAAIVAPCGDLARRAVEPEDDVYDARVAYADGFAVAVVGGRLVGAVEGEPCPAPFVQVQAGEIRIVEWVIRGADWEDRP